MSELPSREVKGRCPICRGTTLFLGNGGHITCSWIDCSDPGAVDDILRIEGRLIDPEAIDYEAGTVAVINAMFAMREAGISLPEKHQVALAFPRDGIQRLTVGDVLRIGTSAALGIGDSDEPA